MNNFTPTELKKLRKIKEEIIVDIKAKKKLITFTKVLIVLAIIIIILDSVLLVLK